MLGCVFRGTFHCASDIPMPESAEDDLNHMRAALALARRGLGTTWPNPSVGCVLVRDGRVVGRGYTGSGGRPHAEPTALSMAGEAAQRCDRVCHAGAVLPLGADPALHGRADPGRVSPAW